MQFIRTLITSLTSLLLLQISPFPMLTQGVSQGFEIGRPKRFLWAWPNIIVGVVAQKHVFGGVAAIFCYGIVVLLFVEPLFEIYR